MEELDNKIEDVIPNNFYELKVMLENFKEFKFPKYSKDLTMKWEDIIKAEDLRKRIDMVNRIKAEDLRNRISNQDLKGIVVIYVSVGDMINARAEKVVQTMQEKCKDTLQRIPLSYGVIWIPDRVGQTRLELIKF